MHRSLAACALLAGALLSAGCGTHDHRRLGFEADHARRIAEASLSQPLEGRFAHVGIEPTLLGEAAPADDAVEFNEEFAFPREAFDESLARILREVGAFESVHVLPGEGAPPPDPGEPAFPDDGLVLQLELLRQSVRFVGRNWNSVWGIAFWLSGFGVPSIFIHDEEFSLDFVARARIVDAATNEVLRDVDLGECAAAETLSLNERIDSIWPYFFTYLIPPILIPSDEEAVVEALLPVALGDSLGTLTRAFEEIARTRSPHGVRILLGKAQKLEFEFRSPVRDQVVDGETVDLDFDVILPKDTSDLLQVRVNGEIVLDARKDGEKIPAGNRVAVQVNGVAFDRSGEIGISVLTLYGNPEEVRIWRPGGRAGAGR